MEKFLLPKGDFVNQLKQRQTVLLNEIKKRQERLKNAPDGELYILRKKDSCQYYKREKSQKRGTYIKKEDKDLILALAQKKYNKTFIKKAQKEIKHIKRFLENYSESISDIYSKLPREVQSMVQPVDMSDEDYANKWQSEEYKRKPIDESVAEHITIRGERVRSKSEELIANTLHRMGIPYKYECPIVLYNREVIHPDFTILDAKTRKIFYYEHLGKMEDPKYVMRNIHRLKDYEQSGIILGKNLIISYETMKCPLNTRTIENIISQLISV